MNAFAEHSSSASNVHILDDIDDVRIEDVDRSLASHRFAVLRGLISAAEVAEAMAGTRAAFRPEDDHPTIGELPSDVRANYQKFSIGTIAKTSPPQNYARVLRVIFSPLFAEDRYGLHDVMRRLALVRNRLLGVPDGFALDGVELGAWTAARIQHYPRGGGFLSTHVDAATVAVSERIAQRYLQVLLVMTQRGVDFESGGAYLEHEGRRVDVEASLEVGDIVVYDGRTPHGVADIDPHRTMDLRTLDGRLVGLVSLYEAR